MSPPPVTPRAQSIRKIELLAVKQPFNSSLAIIGQFRWPLQRIEPSSPVLDIPDRPSQVPFAGRALRQKGENTIGLGHRWLRCYHEVSTAALRYAKHPQIHNTIGNRVSRSYKAEYGLINYQTAIVQNGRNVLDQYSARF